MNHTLSYSGDNILLKGENAADEMFRGITGLKLKYKLKLKVKLKFKEFLRTQKSFVMNRQPENWRLHYVHIPSKYMKPW